MAVSQNTVVLCPLAVGGAEYGGGCFLFQLGRMGMLSCLYRFFSGRWRALISRHKMRFFSIISIMVASPQSQGIWKQQCKGQRLQGCRAPAVSPPSVFAVVVYFAAVHAIFGGSLRFSGSLLMCTLCAVLCKPQHAADCDTFGRGLCLD